MKFVLTTLLNTLITQKAMVTQHEGKQFCLNILEKLRSKEGRSQYIHFLDTFVSAGIGCKKWKNNRLLKPLSDYFSISDEAFVLLTYDCYNEKWTHEYMTKNKLYNENHVMPNNVVSQHINSTRGKKNDVSVITENCQLSLTNLYFTFSESQVYRKRERYEAKLVR